MTWLGLSTIDSARATRASVQYGKNPVSSSLLSQDNCCLTKKPVFCARYRSTSNGLIQSETVLLVGHPLGEVQGDCYGSVALLGERPKPLATDAARTAEFPHGGSIPPHLGCQSGIAEVPGWFLHGCGEW